MLVSDRHDNIGMDPVARAVADLGGATVLLDAGDDTSTGSSWEAFSLESLDEAFSSFEERYLVTGNHDHGSFVAGQAADLGFTVMDAEVVEAADDIRLLGVADPRSSGLGSWREETGLSFDDVGERLADAACAADADGERVGTLLVHDANLGREALARGCTDLVVGGHLHDIVGPDGSRVRTARSATGSRPAPRGARRTRSPWAPSPGARRRCRCSPTARASRSGSSRWSCRRWAPGRSPRTSTCADADREPSPDRSRSRSETDEPGPTDVGPGSSDVRRHRTAEVAGFEPARGFSPQPA